MMLMSTVKELLDVKGRATWVIDSESTVYDAVASMAEKNIGALIVQSSESTMVGIISERDCARKIMLKDRNSKSTRVSEIMTAEVVMAKESTSLNKCMALMLENRIRHLAIADGDQAIGLITLGDLTKHIIREQSEAIEELESYVFDDQGGEA